MGARPNVPGPGRTVITLFGLVNAPRRKFSEIGDINVLWQCTSLHSR